METLFGRKKSRPRQSSVSAQDLNERSIPYDKLTPPTRSPLPVATVSQGYRGISAPSSNPSLTASGTELNKYAVHRSKAERDKLYELHATDKRPRSPSTSISTADSSTLCDDSVPLHVSAYASKFAPQTPHSSRLRLSEASSSSGARSSGAFDFAPATPSTSQNVTIRPASGMTTRSESSRTSKYAPSLASSDHATHHSLFYHSRSHNPSETFYFPRPETDAEIEALFENVKRTRDLGDLPDLPIEQKWHMVYNDEQIRWKDEKLREEQARKQGEVGQHTIVQESPEWYIRKFLDGTITPKQASSLLVSLRGKEMSWFRQFVAIQGPSVLAQTLHHLSRKGSSRSDYDMSLEYEVVKCLKQILNYAPTAKDVLGQPYFVTQIASSLNTPHIPTRKLTLDLLSFITYYDEARYHQMVVSALEALSVANNEGSACYDYWFKSMEQSILGRGKMGSLVGASDEVRRAGGIDSSLNDYALANLLLLNGVVEHIEDLDVRLHHRSQMESAGLQRIIDICQRFEIEALDKHLKILRTRLDDDERRLRERLDQEILRDLNNPQEIYNAIYAKTQNTKAQSCFLSMMRHLLLIREEGQSMVHYYQLLDSLVTDVVMDKKLAGAEQRFGHSVERIIAQFNEADRYQALESELAEMRTSAVRFKLEKEALEDEIAQGHDGLVGQLKSQLAHAEEKLNVSRETTSRLQGQLATQRADYEERITQLEAQIMELFRMLREVGKGVEMVLDGGVLDRKALVQQLEKDFQRKKTISILEGKDGYARKLKNPDIPAATEGVAEKDLDTTPVKRMAGRGSRAASSTKRSPGLTKPVAVDDNGRTSQFMDAEEADAQEQIQQQIAAGVTIYSPPVGTVSASRSVRGSPRRTFKPPLGSALDSSSQSYSLLSPPPKNPESTSDASRSSPTFDDEDSSPLSVRSESSDRTETTGLTSLNLQNMNSVKDENILDIDSSTQAIQAVDKGLPPPPPPPPPPMMPGPAALERMQGPAPPPPPPPPPPMGHSTPIASVLKSSIFPPPPPPPPPSKKNSPSNSARTSRTSALLGPVIGNLLMARKDMPITPSIKMKQLQWDKLPHQQVAKTLWKEEQPDKENEMLEKLRKDGVWSEIEEDFKAKQLVINLMARQKRAELKSVLDPQTKKRVEILIQRVRKLEPEEIAQRICQFDQDLCNQAFLSELKTVLPSPEQVGKLSVYRNADSVELADLHPSDRLMVQLIKIDRLGPRIEGMLYKCTFEESWALLDDGARKLSKAGRSLLEAKYFKELLSLILLIGNYMNGTGIKGGAFGFRVSSINKLVDTKSVNNTTLLHFLEKTVSKQFPEMQGFLDELEKPAEAYRVNLQDLRKSLTELRDGLKRIRHELGEHFSDMAQNDQYGKQMWSFIGRASAQMDDLIYDISNAETTFTDVIDYYGEEDKSMSSSEFYGIFKTFVTSYKKCQADNHAAAEEKQAIEKRKQALQQTKISRQQAEAMFADEGDDILDNLLEKLRKGDTVARRARRARPSGEPTGLSLSSSIQDFPASNETVDRARNMLAQLQSDGFVTSVSPTTSTFQRRRRRRAESVGEDQVSMGMGSPLASEIRIEEDEEDVESVNGGTM